MKFKIGDKVRCIKIEDPIGICGAGWEEGLVFTIDKIDFYSEGDIIIWRGKGGNGVYEEWLELFKPKNSNIIFVKEVKNE